MGIIIYGPKVDYAVKIRQDYGKTRIILALRLKFRIVVLNYSCYRSMLLEHSWFLYSSFFSRFGSRGGSLFCSSYCTEVKTKRRPPLSLFIPLFRKRRRQKDANISTKGEVLLHGGLEETVICRIERMSFPICNSVMVKLLLRQKKNVKNLLYDSTSELIECFTWTEAA